jgi:hypothetical protein
MERTERTAIMDAISRAGDQTLLDFAAYCMRTIEEEGELTASDVEIFADTHRLLPHNRT